MVVLCVPSVDEVESRNTISLAADSCWVRFIISVMTRTAQQDPSCDRAVLTSAPAKGANTRRLAEVTECIFISTFCGH